MTDIDEARVIFQRTDMIISDASYENMSAYKKFQLKNKGRHEHALQYVCN